MALLTIMVSMAVLSLLLSSLVLYAQLSDENITFSRGTIQHHYDLRSCMHQKVLEKVRKENIIISLSSVEEDC